MDSNNLQARADMELQMLQQTAQKKQLEAQMPKAIGEKEILKASETLRKYKEGKARLEAKLIANEEFWKLRQWNYINDTTPDFKPATAWLWNCIQSRYSDVMDSYPTCNFLPRQEDDKAEALKLSSIVPVILEQNRYEETYSDIAWYMLKQGGCCQGVFWDQSKHNGLGDISIKKIDFINLFWESGCTDIQDSANVFYTELVSNKFLESKYPQTVGKLGGKKITLAKYIYDDHVDTDDKSVVVDWYYKKWVNGKETLQYVKFVNNVVLYATENETARPEKVVPDMETGIPLTVPTGLSMAERGLYDHAMYPFVTQPLYPVEGSLCGFGLTDIGRDTQLIIDRLNKSITDNSVIGSTPRYFIRDDGNINEAEYSDINKKFVHVQGKLGEEDIRPVDTKQLDGAYINFLDQKINEIKYVTSNQDANNGVAPSGVTSASGIVALQETAGKNARSTNKSFYRAYREVVYQVVELIRQFYDMPRMFRINPDGMQEAFISYDNSGLVPQQQIVGGNDMGLRKPEFDIEVTAEKANPYKKVEINDLALQFYSAGFFNPEMSTQALACLGMMDFQQKNDVIKTIEQNGTLQQMLLQYQQMALQLAQQVDPALADQIGQQIMGTAGMMQSAVGGGIELQTENNDEHPFVERSRKMARNSTEVN